MKGPTNSICSGAPSRTSSCGPARHAPFVGFNCFHRMLAASSTEARSTHVARLESWRVEHAILRDEVPVAPKGIRRLRGALKTALASVIAKAHDHGLTPAYARGGYRPLVLGYHRVVEDYHAQARVEMPSMLTSRAMFERHLDCL